MDYPKQHHRVIFSNPEYAQKTIKDNMKTIKEIREKAGLISCSRNTLSAAENGKSVLSARLLHAVSEKLWISEDWLRFGVGGMERSEKIAEVLEAIQSDPNVRDAVLIFLKKEIQNQNG